VESLWIIFPQTFSTDRNEIKRKVLVESTLALVTIPDRPFGVGIADWRLYTLQWICLDRNIHLARRWQTWGFFAAGIVRNTLESLGAIALWGEFSISF
jgi:hypothetical protein